MSRLDNTLDHLVDQGRIAPNLADEIRVEYHSHHTDNRGRLAELAAYAGAGLAVTGVVVIGSQVWTDIGQVMRAIVPAVCSAGLLLGTWLLARSGFADHPARARLAQVLGVAAAVLGAAAMAVAFSIPSDADQDRPWQPVLALTTGLLIALVACRWSPGFLTTLAAGLLACSAGLSAVGLLPGDTGGPGPAGLYLMLLGIVASLVLARAFPPEWLTRLMGVTAWVFGSLMLLMSHEEYDYLGDPQSHWTWLGRLGAIALVIVGSWLFARGGDWPWAVGAVIGAALLVGLWSASALNAGVALIVAGIVLVGVGAGLAKGRQVFGGRPPRQPAKMGL